MTWVSARQSTATTKCSDRFVQDLPTGTVIGSKGPSGAVRLGVDAERLMAVDHGALRMRPLARPGWSREVLAYGPFDPVPGLAFATLVLNGHMASQTYYPPESALQRLRRILADARRFRFRRPRHHENFAVGLTTRPDGGDPLGRGHSLVVHSATEYNGELWCSVRHQPSRIVRGVQNLPFVFVVAVRSGGAAYYTSSLPGATGASPYPSLRPVGIDTSEVQAPVYAVVQQRILGEVGYSVDTRVHGVEVAPVEEWAQWYGTASLADRLRGSGAVHSTGAETGQLWQPIGKGLMRTPDGAVAAGVGTSGISVDPGEPTGLLHIVIWAGRNAGSVELRWRVERDGSHLAVAVSKRGCRVISRDGTGSELELLDDPSLQLRPGLHRLQVLDDGTNVNVQLDGKLAGSTWCRASSGTGGQGLAVLAGAGVQLRDVESHPRCVALPAELDPGAPWAPPPSVPSVDERFDAIAADLHGARTPSGGRTWRRAEGTGVIRLEGGGARVEGSPPQPNPGRTVFTIPWHDADFADLSLEMTVPGTERGQGHNGRCGIVFWQDPDNYLIVNVFVDDAFDGASISTFYHLDGEENMYDAVWTLVRGVEFGKRCTLRATFDGERFLASANGEPSLVRALTDVYPGAASLQIREVGIVVNREWGDDTGSVLHRFTAGRAGRS